MTESTDPPSKLWTTISNLSGNTIVAGVLIYVTTVTMPGLSHDFRTIVAEQRADFLQAVSQNRTDFLNALQTERQWNEQQQRIMTERQQMLHAAVLDLKQTLITMQNKELTASTPAPSAQGGPDGQTDDKN